LFKDEKTNPNGALLIFSTHYLEILDIMNRKDNIYVTRKDKEFNLSVIKFSDKIERNDVKKSDIFLSNSFMNTAPSYEIIQKIKEDLCQKLK
jgi:GH25 family lysozyme M1 (1,4-beta-N-acetylmuramidase)